MARPAATDVSVTAVAEADGEQRSAVGSTDSESAPPTAVGELVDFELGPINLRYDSGYWQLERPFEQDDDQQATALFVNSQSLAVVSVNFWVTDPATEVDPCWSDYAGERDPADFQAELLHQETVGNGGRLRIYRRADGLIDPESVITTAVVQFDTPDERQVGNTGCMSPFFGDESWRSIDGSLTRVSVTGSWTFADGQWVTPFDEQFESSDAVRARDGYAEMLTLIETIELAGTPSPQER